MSLHKSTTRLYTLGHIRILDQCTWPIVTVITDDAGFGPLSDRKEGSGNSCIPIGDNRCCQFLSNRREGCENSCILIGDNRCCQFLSNRKEGWIGQHKMLPPKNKYFHHRYTVQSTCTIVHMSSAIGWRDFEKNCALKLCQIVLAPQFQLFNVAFSVGGYPKM